MGNGRHDSFLISHFSKKGAREDCADKYAHASCDDNDGIFSDTE